MVSQLHRYRVELVGVVQGVGFRPHVARCAADAQVTGFCGNNDAAVFIETQGSRAAITEFIDAVLSTLPPLAVVTDHHREEIPTISGETGFRIVESQRDSGAPTLIPPDTAVCADCRVDMNDPSNRRYRYPFTTCTHCGPRLSIITSVPYDRPNTTMRIFPMCADCAREYADPTDRRYHAQPISCPNCGPRLWLERDGHEVPGDLDTARQWLAEGQILAVKGIGGFHLMCDARNERSVARLRTLKRRPSKPFAVMAPPADAPRLAHLSVSMLDTPTHPIVIAPQAESYDLAPSVAPGNNDIGLMLPYTPLHILLVDRPVVATSGNLSGEPLCFELDSARTALAHMVDGWVMHDRPIHVPVEDSVQLLSGEATGGDTPEANLDGSSSSVVRAPRLLPIRRSRGAAPLPLPLTIPAVPGAPCGEDATVLAVGGELKNTCAVLTGDTVHMSSHVGDMGSWAAQVAFERCVGQLLSMRRREPDVVVCDMHPNYATTAWAERSGLPLVRVQHHHAHALSLLAEHGMLDRRAVIATLDGTGYGLDGTIWGGEILRYTPGKGLERVWHIPEFPLVGGDRAVRFPWRLAAGIGAAYDLSLPGLVAPAEERTLVESQLASGVGAVACTSLGRLIDATSSLLGLCHEQTFEAEAAMSLEACARQAAHHLDSEANSLRELVAEATDGTPAPEAAWRFHAGLARLLAQQLRSCAQASGAETIGITGGCAVNRLLLSHLRHEIPLLLEHQVVPANDGGLSLGQAVAARVLPLDDAAGRQGLD